VYQAGVYTPVSYLCVTTDNLQDENEELKLNISVDMCLKVVSNADLLNTAEKQCILRVRVVLI